jgi:glyoxylase-like metal-dependent hydrolase (beta-lactamase superfamily II)
LSEVMTPFGEHVYLVHGDRNAQFPFCNGLVIKDEQTLVVDPGVGEQRLAAVFEQLGLELDHLDLLLLTHYHYDHRGRSATIHGSSGCEVLAHANDAPAIQDYDVFKMYTGITASPYEAEWDHWARSFLDLQTCPVTRTLQDGDHLRLGATEWLVLHTPGHTPGHISLYEPRLRFLFAADVDLTHFGPWYGNIVSDIPAFRHSVGRLSSLVNETGPERITVTTGHRHTAIVNPVQAFATYAEHFATREQQILALLQRPRTLDQLADCNIIYDHPSFAILRFFERIMLEKHLEDLRYRNLIEETRSGKWRRSVSVKLPKPSQAPNLSPEARRRDKTSRAD